jgi:hypothetical protein
VGGCAAFTAEGYRHARAHADQYEHEVIDARRRAMHAPGHRSQVHVVLDHRRPAQRPAQLGEHTFRKLFN